MARDNLSGVSPKLRSFVLRQGFTAFRFLHFVACYIERRGERPKSAWKRPIGNWCPKGEDQTFQPTLDLNGRFCRRRNCWALGDHNVRPNKNHSTTTQESDSREQLRCRDPWRPHPEGRTSAKAPRARRVPRTGYCGAFGL